MRNKFITNLILLTFVVLFCNVSYSNHISKKGDNEIFKNSVYLELLGNGIFYSINYERVLYSKSGIAFNLRSGIGYLPSKVSPDLFLPNTITMLISLNSSSKIEIGGGALFLINREKSSNNLEEEGFTDPFAYFTTGVIGYRFSPKNQKIFFRACFTPWIENNSYRFKEKINPWAGLSMGFSF